MATYYASTWGIITGKVGDGIGTRIHGKNILKAYKKSNHPKTSNLAIQKILSAKYKKNDVCIPQINHQRLIFPLVVYLSKALKKDFIIPIWNPLTKGKYLTGANLFLKSNIPPLSSSIPSKNKLCSNLNSPDLQKLILSQGSLENSPILNAIYLKTQGTLTVNWNNSVYRNGKPDDLALILAIYFSIPPNFWQKNPPLNKLIKIWHNMSSPFPHPSSLFHLRSPAQRQNESAHLSIPKSLNHKNLTAFLFFKNNHNQYSPSTSSNC